MNARLWAMAALALLSACAGPGRRPETAASITVQILAFNDFHGNLEPPKQSVAAPGPDGGTIRVPAGGVAYLASAVAARRASHPNSIVVAAGDIIGASPLVSALFLDEPTIAAMNLVGLDLTAVGNHEFDKGRDELLRMQNGGCKAFTLRTPCRLDPNFPGAKFGFLAANTITEDGTPLFPPFAIRSFGSGAARVRIGFIGMTLKDTPNMVTPTGVAGLRFTDEAATANALVPRLREAGADAIVLLIHQGARTEVGYDDRSCAGLAGDLLPILAELDPAFDVVVSGHTHRAYVCDYGKIDPARPFLLTSAGLYGTLLTDITLRFDRRTHRVTGKDADNVIVQGESYAGPAGEVALTDRYPRFPAAPPVAALVARYAAAAGAIGKRVVGHVSGFAARPLQGERETALGNIIADSYLAASRAPPAGGARIALTNQAGIRASLSPAADGSVGYEQLFAIEPFGNTLVVRSFSGRQLLAILEQQFGGTHSITSPYILAPSASLRYAFDLSRPAGSRILDVRVDGVPLDEAATYRIATNNFLDAGGDGFAGFKAGTDPVGGQVDLEAFEAYLANAGQLALPATDRVTDRTPVKPAP